MHYKNDCDIEYLQPGILLLLTSIGISIGTYEHYKKPIAPYVASCIAIEKVLVAAEGILKEDVAGLDKDRIKKAAASFGRLRRNMSLLVAGEGKSDDTQRNPSPGAYGI